MAQAQGQQAQGPMRSGREGGRWVNARPAGTEVAEWFKENVPMHEGLSHERFLSGITLIPSRTKEDEVVDFNQDGSPVIKDQWNLVFTPYIKVETRVAYFWALMELHPEWIGAIEPHGGKRNNLPLGFFLDAQGNLGCQMQVRLVEREGAKFEPGTNRLIGTPVMLPPPATKVVRISDQNSMLRAETGAVGRALAMAGILVAPGSGIATAEDMQELNEPQLPQPATPVDIPSRGDEEQELRDHAAIVIQELEEHYPDTLTQFREWAKSRGFRGLNTLRNPALKGAVRKLESMSNEARLRAGETGQMDAVAADDARAHKAEPDD